MCIFIDYFKWENWTENLSKWGRISFRFTIIDIVHELVRLNHFKPEQRQTMSYSSLSFYILAPSVPTCYRSIAFHGFIEELVVNDDPEYQVFPSKFLLVKLCLINEQGCFIRYKRREAIAECFIPDKTRTANLLNGLKNEPLRRSLT